MDRPTNVSQATRLSWRVENAAASKHAEIDLFDIIGDPWMGTTAKDFVAELRELDVDTITLNINSPGGVVNDALAMYDAIQNHPATITARIVNAASAASFVAQGANKREITKNGKVYIHDANVLVIGGNAAALRALADILDEESENIASIYADRVGGTTAEWRERMQANEGIGSTYRGQEAVDIGLVDEIAEAPSRNLEPGRIAAQEIAPPPPVADIPLDLIPPLANGYKPPLPADFTRLVAANLPRGKAV
jgi:ATP-dependent protease ClpP protease subunit